MNWKPEPAPFRKFKKEILKKSSSVSDFIYQIGEYPELRKQSSEVPIKQIPSKIMQKKFAYLKQCLLTYRKRTGYGRGISAVQVGIPEQFAAIYYKEKCMIIINPRVIIRCEKKYVYPEICMSAYPIIVPTVRPAWIEFSYYDENGKINYWDTKDTTQVGKMINRVLQHEIDHMEGIINVDRVSSPAKLILQSDPSFYDSAKFEEV